MARPQPDSHQEEAKLSNCNRVVAVAPPNVTSDNPSTRTPQVHEADGRNNQQTDDDRKNKRKRWEAKQARRQEQTAKEAERQSWIEQHSSFCTHVSLEDVQQIKSSLGGTTNDSPAQASKEPATLCCLEEWLRPYLDLKEGPPKKRASSTNDSDHLFIAEGTETVRLLLQKSCYKPKREKCSSEPPIRVISILVKPATLFDPPVQLLTEVQKAIAMKPPTRDNSDGMTQNQTNDVEKSNGDGTSQADPPFHILVGPEEALSAVAGFQKTRGALACGIVPRRNESWLGAFLASRSQSPAIPLRVLALDGISDTANLGSIIRCAAAFGIDAIVLSHDCCDAWYRRSVRVSMGHIFHVPIVRVDDLSSTIRRLSSASHATNIPSYAAVVDQDAELVLERVNRGEISKRWCCVMGNEANGISTEVIEACTCRLRIGMASKVDSLSVPIATGIILHGLKERESSSSPGQR